ncbi:uncharacterized protein BYT42DRAFT_374834 [Radiomyces spectabilis]|uniref:uncharacterized protein n=1 Tax=Radiomyces spectabilis TaxID=64574 RepID=UPI00222115B1|nr:uncharacterized protein BYT42DRAFT_374834 [Radiomyces spectabilis]KAI8376106.1 hypothetical protein BYT42DRAFT_374834 [Radiomyces spectabilis]
MAQQFEKYRHAMQKEIDLLQTKNRKLEASLRTVMLEKNETQASLLAKDQELADLRSKNTIIQKSLARQEKSTERSPRVVQLEKKIEQLRKELESTQAETAQIKVTAMQKEECSQALMQEKEAALKDLKQELEQQHSAHLNLRNQLEKSQDATTTLQTQYQETLHALDETKKELSLACERAERKDQEIAALQMRVGDLENQVDRCIETQQSLEEEIQQTKLHHQEERIVWQEEKAGLCHLTEQLQVKLADSDQQTQVLELRLCAAHDELDRCATALADKDDLIEKSNRTIVQLQKQFSVYRTYMNRIVIDCRTQAQKNCEKREAELDRLLKELYEAKKFINRQAQHLDGLKSEIHWLSKWNRSLWELTQALDKDTVARQTWLLDHLNLGFTENLSCTSLKQIVATFLKSSVVPLSSTLNAPQTQDGVYNDSRFRLMSSDVKEV